MVNTGRYNTCECFSLEMLTLLTIVQSGRLQEYVKCCVKPTILFVVPKVTDVFIRVLPPLINGSDIILVLGHWIYVNKFDNNCI